MGVKDISSEAVLERIEKFEASVIENLRRIEESLSQGQETFQFVRDGLAGYRQRHLHHATNANAPIGRWLARIQTDDQLGFPHRKILHCLLNEYDFASQQFRELHFTAICKKARVGKNMLKAYLNTLIERRYIEQRDDGYRKHYKLRDKY